MWLVGNHTLRISVAVYLLNHRKVIVEGLVLSERIPG